MFAKLHNEALWVTTDLVTEPQAYSLHMFVYLDHLDLCEWGTRPMRKLGEGPGVWESIDPCYSDLKKVGRVRLEARKCAFEVFMLVFDQVWLESFYLFVWDAVFVFEGNTSAYMYLPVTMFDSAETGACADSLMVWNSSHPEVPCLECVVWRSCVFVRTEPILFTRRILEGELPINPWNEVQVEDGDSEVWKNRSMVLVPAFNDFIELGSSNRYKSWVIVFDELLMLSLRFVQVRSHYLLNKKYVCMTLETFTRFFKEAFRVLHKRLFSNFFEVASFPIQEFAG
jgi:hypothetical protein